MAGDNRGSSSLFRRAEQLRRWQESETNKQDVIDKPKKRKVKFSDGCIFLAAGAAGDKEELKRLLDRGADINTVNQDGITALHAACIDNNLEIVEFLVDNNADINRCDMEGWTPLHATASCGSLYMAEFLISRGADLSVVNNDGELAIDVVDEDDMAKLLQEEMDRRGIDCDASRSREERHMVEDAQSWLNSGQILDIPHDKTGATALHVAAAKGYIKVMRLLIDAGASINTKDLDGWTPLHAAAHWGQTEAVEILCDSMANMDGINNVSQTPYDLADDSIKPLMDELRRKQASAKLISQNKIMSKKRKPSPHRERGCKKEKEAVKRESDGTSSDVSLEHDVEKRSCGRVDSSVDQSEVQSWRRPSIRNKSLQEEKSSKEDASKGVSQLNHKDTEVVLRKDSSVKEDRMMPRQKAVSCLLLCSPSERGGEEKEDEGKGSLRRTISFSNTLNTNKTNFYVHSPPKRRSVNNIHPHSLSIGDRVTSRRERSSTSPDIITTTIPRTVSGDVPTIQIISSQFSSPSSSSSSVQDVSSGLRRANSLSDSLNNEGASNAFNKFSNSAAPSSRGSLYGSNRHSSFDLYPSNSGRSSTFGTSTHLSPKHIPHTTITTCTNSSTTKPYTNNFTFTRSSSSISNSSGHHVLPTNTNPFEKSSSLRCASTSDIVAPVPFLPSSFPYLDSAPSATNLTNKNPEVLLRSQSLKARLQRNCQDILRVSDNHVTTTPSNTLSTSPTRHVCLLHSTRSFAPPSRDDESETQRKAHAKMVRSTRRSTQGITLEDLKSAEQYIKSKNTTATSNTTTTTTTNNANTNNSTTITSSGTNQSASATIEIISATPTTTTTVPSSPASVAETTATNTASNQDSSFSLDASHSKAKERSDSEVTNVTLPLKKKSVVEEKKDDKTEDKGSTTREGTQAVIQRRRKAKRRSTGVVHVDMDEIDPDRKSDKRDEDEAAEEGSVSDRESGSKSSKRVGSGGHNGDIDYKKLYEEQLSENDKLMQRLREHERDLRLAKETIDSNGKTSTARSALAESERREKRALERKLSEMEEELRELDQLRQENQRLKDENGALIRVISKLSR